ncbi:mRNA decapping complex subunit 2 [Hyphodiscus hymeniophilus]|uniref:mRNA decapping complex subunit 2 n=1 Tax=Hyphodiscus hymeniophilus TaxID=353542 RepID=A0A9P7AWU9_9HELO|nr:mRNA decapping complex subunit 2 [Hyphodiscus hymeniophilus]
MADTNMQLEDWLDDLCVRFIINLPDTELSSVERICFSIEEAQWYYEDFIRPLDPNLPSLTLRNFSMRIFTHCPLLAPFSQGDHMRAFDEFLKYKTRIPVRGAILMNDEMDSAILVKGWKKGANWSFPRGKINWAEDDLTCAIREVYEETGYDIQAAGLVPEDRQVKHIDITMHDQQMRLYVFRDVPMETHFEPRTRKEISKIQWWRLSDLPAYRKKAQQQQNKPAISPNKFYMVAPFLPHLRKWVIEQKKQDAKRVTSNQYLSAGISHDEFLTEEDQGAESNTPGPALPAPAREHIDTLEGTNEALRALLKIKAPTQGLQAGVQRPVTENKGGALLALLHGNPAVSNQQASSNAPPQTPLDHTITQAPQPATPHYHHLQASDISTLPPPPNFPIQVPTSFSYQEPVLQHHSHPSNMNGVPQNQSQNLYQTQRPYGNPHSYQNQNLVHPQPLPPNVQKAVFTGGPVHSPMVPQTVQEAFSTQANSTTTSGPSNPQFPGLHAPMVPQVQAQPSGKLNSHALALLNAFKSQDQPKGGLPLRRYMDEPEAQLTARPQELPAEVSRPVAANPLGSEFALKQTIPPTPKNLVASKPISEEQRSALLGLFKSPTAQTVLSVRANDATALPMTTTPSAVELSAVDTLSSNAARSSPATVSYKKAEKKAEKVANVPEMNPETNLPFRAMKILARPSQTSESESPNPHTSTPKMQRNGKRPVSRSKAHRASPPEKPFQRQTFKRPQSNTPKTAEPSAVPTPPLFPAMPNPPSSQQQTRPAANEHKQTLQSLFGKPSSSPSFPQLDRSTAQPAEHKQKLLSLFGAPSPSRPAQAPANEDVLSPLFSIDPTQNSIRSRMGSLASADATSQRSSQTPMSPADKGFLLSYLDSVAKGVQR